MLTRGTPITRVVLELHVRPIAVLVPLFIFLQIRAYKWLTLPHTVNCDIYYIKGNLNAVFQVSYLTAWKISKAQLFIFFLFKGI